MKSKILFGLMSLSFSLASFADAETAYKKLRENFNAHRSFFNFALNDFRDGIQSSFLAADLPNNAKPLSNDLMKRLPEAQFIGRDAFYLAYKGRERLIKAKKISANTLLAVADFSQHSKYRRFYLFDLNKMKVVTNSYTSHAYNSDKNRDGFADNFSNVPKSETSSLGFMMTGETYYGMWGYSLRLKGLDPSLNSNVLSRAVVVHGLGGMDPTQAAYGAMATSQGCFMFSSSESGRFWGFEDKPLHEVVINQMKAGTLLFSYVDGDNAIFESTWINHEDLPKDIREDEREVPYSEVESFDDILPADVSDL